MRICTTPQVMSTWVAFFLQKKQPIGVLPLLPLMGRDAGGAAPPTGLLLFAKKSNPLGFAKKSNSLGCFSWQGRWWGSAPDQWIRIIFDRGAAPKRRAK